VLSKVKSIHTRHERHLDAYGGAGFVLNRVREAQVTSAGIFVGQQQGAAGFIQDSWKVMLLLTLNVGFRYEYDQPWYEQNLEHFPCRCRAASRSLCGISLRKGHAEMHSASTQHEGNAGVEAVRQLDDSHRFNFYFSTKCVALRNVSLANLLV
jgi:hypothetical protein